jgi:tetratricopeptide (TPR) repeat protein
MPNKVLPTRNPDALRTFISGSEQFREYLISGKADLLNDAGRSFTDATTHDPNFKLARFYRSLVQTEMRKADSAIQGLSELLAEGVEFRAEVLIHLAYAHIKRYTDDDFFEAERFLREAREQAAGQRRTDLTLLTNALLVFLYSVMGGYLSRAEERPSYIDRALELGEELLKGPLKSIGQAEARFEVLNGLGIAHMRKGNLPEQRDRATEWHTAARCFHEALEIRSNSVRVMQNLGLLKGMGGLSARSEGKGNEASEYFSHAKTWFLKSLGLNPNDQYPHYRLSQLFALTGDWESAKKYLNSGRVQSGAVKPQQWQELEGAISSLNASGLRW